MKYEITRFMQEIGKVEWVAGGGEYVPYWSNERERAILFNSREEAEVEAKALGVKSQDNAVVVEQAESILEGLLEI